MRGAHRKGAMSPPIRLSARTSSSAAAAALTSLWSLPQKQQRAMSSRTSSRSSDAPQLRQRWFFAESFVTPGVYRKARDGVPVRAARLGFRLRRTTASRCSIGIGTKAHDHVAAGLFVFFDLE